MFYNRLDGKCVLHIGCWLSATEAVRGSWDGGLATTMLTISTLLNTAVQQLSPFIAITGARAETNIHPKHLSIVHPY